MPHLEQSTLRSEDEEMTVAALARPMSAFVRTEMTAGELAVFLLDRRLGCVAVVDDAERVVGFVSMMDLVREHVMEEKARGEAPHRTRVGDMMMPSVLTLPEDATIARAAAVMATRGVHRLLLLGPGGEAIGMVHAIDVLRWFARSQGVYVPNDPTR
jgi:predicted transcriptional regulator